MAEQPPSIDEVLVDGEKVEWAGKERTSFNYACLIVIALFVIPVIAVSPIPLLSPIALLSYLYGIIVISIAIRNSLLYPKWYRITNLRLLEMRGKRILKQIDCSQFSDRSLNESISMRLDHHANEKGSSPVYDITFYNPKTTEPLIIFNDIWYLYTQESEVFHGMQECSSCKVLISSKLEKCLACGQSLV